MNPGMKNPLTSMLYPTVLIIVKEVLLMGTAALIEITMSTVGTTARTGCREQSTQAEKQQRTSVLLLCRSPLYH